MEPTPIVPTLPLHPRGEVPMLGFGTYPMKGDECRQAVETAIECGYTHLDTADIYGNHDAVGAALQTAGIPRDRLFLTTKVWRDHLEHDAVIASCERSLAELGVDYLDLLLVHWPNNAVPMEETFSALGRLVERGLIRACGVSNFTASRLERALALGLAPISVNQVEYHPMLNQKELHRFCAAHGVAMTAYSPLAQGKAANEPAIQAIARNYDRTPAQVTLRWLLQRGIIAIPKASKRERIESNLQVFDFELAPDDFAAMDSMDAGMRLIAWDIAEFDR